MKILAIEVSQFGNYYNSRYQWVEKYGYEVFVLSGHAEQDHWHPGRFTIAKSIQVEDLIEAACALHVKHQFAGIFTFAESSVIATSIIAKALDLPGLDINAAVQNRNKYAMRQAHQRYGAPHPEFYLIPDLNTALEAAEKIGYPVILKPTLGAGSQFVYKINNEAELRENFPLALDGIKTMRLIKNERLTRELGQNTLLLESFLDGRELLIEAYIWDDRVVLGSIVDRVTLEGDNFDDDVHHAPTDLTLEQIQMVHTAVYAGAKAQGLHRSVMHAEIRFHQGNPYILEIAARPGGGGLDFMARISANYCPLQCTVDICVGNKPKYNNYCPSGKDTFAMCLISDQGEVTEITVPESVSQDLDVFMLKFVVEPGMYVRRPPNGNDIVGFLGVSGNSRAATESKVMHYADLIKVSVK